MCVRAFNSFLGACCRKELILQYSRLSEEATRRERRAMWRAQRSRLDDARAQFFTRDRQQTQVWRRQLVVEVKVLMREKESCFFFFAQPLMFSIFFLFLVLLLLGLAGKQASGPAGTSCRGAAICSVSTTDCAAARTGSTTRRFSRINTRFLAF